MFEQIRPYNDEETAEAWRGLLRDPEVVTLFRHGGMEIRPEFHEVDGVRSFQWKVMKPITEKLLSETTGGLTCSGLENIIREENRSFLFVSNHRDIALDAALMIYVLGINGHEGVYMAVGDNLFVTPLVSAVFKMNRGFVVKRGLPMREQLQASRELSEYLHALRVQGASVWIAQREGRAKDGNDFTNPALFSMLHLSQRKAAGFSEYINRLNIIPVSISYEYDPCDELKARELLCRERGEVYVKKPDEDLNSIIKGLLGYKGRLHFAFGSRLRGEFRDVREAAGALDRAIIMNYRQMPANLAAYEELTRTRSGLVGETDRQKFLDRVNTVPEELRPLMLAMYANPVRNRERYLKAGG